MWAGVGPPPVPTVVALGLCLAAVGRTAALAGYLAPAPALDSSKNEVNPEFDFAKSLGQNAATAVMNALAQGEMEDDDSSISPSSSHHLQGRSRTLHHEPDPLDSVPESYDEDAEEEAKNAEIVTKKVSPQSLQAAYATKKKMVKSLVMDVVNDYVASGKVFLRAMLKDVVKSMDKAFAVNHNTHDDDAETSEERRTSEELLAQVKREQMVQNKVWDNDMDPTKKGRIVTDNVRQKPVKHAAHLLLSREHQAQQMMKEAKKLMAAAEAANADVVALKEKLNTKQDDHAINLSLLNTESSRITPINDMHEMWHDVQHARHEAERARKAVADEEMSPYKNEVMLEEFRIAEKNANEELKHRLDILKSYRDQYGGRKN